MTVACALMTHVPQKIEPRSWTPVRFDVVLRNDLNMFRASSMSDPDSALIWPPFKDYFLWAMKTEWEAITPWAPGAPQAQFLQQLCRDPYGYTDNPRDTTGTDDDLDTPGKDFTITAWPIVGVPGTPVSMRVWHDHTEPVNLIGAQFKAICWGRDA